MIPASPTSPAHIKKMVFGSGTVDGLTREMLFDMLSIMRKSPTKPVAVKVIVSVKVDPGANVMCPETVPKSPGFVLVGQFSVSELNERLNESLPVTPQVIDALRSWINKPFRPANWIVSDWLKVPTPVCVHGDFAVIE